MSDGYSGFQNRLRRIDRRHVRLAQGYESRVGKDGLIVFRPKRRSRGFPLRGIVLLGLGFCVFKGVILAHTGETLYEQRLAALGSGTYVEQAGAWVMQVDPVTQAIGAKLRHLVE
jgi:hypothetical protein